VIRGVADVAGFGFPDGLADGVATSLGFPHGTAYGVTNLLLACLVYVAGAIDNPIFAHSVIDRFAARHLLLLPFNTAHRLHDGMTMLLVATRSATTVTCDPAVPRPCY
jgi:hypothetical protein